MRKAALFVMGLIAASLLAACGGPRELMDMEMAVKDGRSAIFWEDRIYFPFCPVSKNDRGEQIGYVNGDKDDRISEYKDYSPEEWLMNWMPMDGGGILYKEERVTDLPDGLTSEYD